MKPAPIALFAYNRPDHVRRTVAALLRNDLAEDSECYVFCDGAKPGGDVSRVEAVRAYCRSVSGFRRVEVRTQPENRGLAASIISGVTEVCALRGRVIVVEDDLVTSPYFLRYMNDGLELYADAPEVASIHGYIYPVRGALPETFFLRGADCWGWATWQRAWDLFEADGQVLLDRLEALGLTGVFDFDGAYGYTEMLRQQIAGRNDSWAIRWHASAFLQDKLTLYPGRSLVRNIGNDSTGTHCGSSSRFDVQTAEDPVIVERIPLQESVTARAAFVDHLGGGSRRSGWRRFRDRLLRRRPSA